MPFEIPENWCWCRLRDIGIYEKGPFGSALTKSIFVQKSDMAVKVYEQQNAIKKNHRLGHYYIKKEYFESVMKNFEVHPGDIIVSCAGTIGEARAGAYKNARTAWRYADARKIIAFNVLANFMFVARRSRRGSYAFFSG